MNDNTGRSLRINEVWRRDAFQRPALLAVGYLACIVFSEVVVTLLAPQLGFLLYGSLLIMLLLHSALSQHGPTRNLLLALALAPLIRLLSYSLPFTSYPRVYWYLIVSVPLFAASALAIRASDLSLSTIGLRRVKLPAQLLLALTGIAFGYIEYHILRLEPLVRHATWHEVWVAVAILLICTGFLEELIFRGLMQHSACQVMGRLGLVFVAVLFAALHIGYRSVVDVLFVFGVGLFFGWAVAWTGSLLGVTLSHGITNIMLFVVMPLASISTPLAPLSGPPPGSLMSDATASLSVASLDVDRGVLLFGALIRVSDGAVGGLPAQPVKLGQAFTARGVACARSAYECSLNRSGFLDEGWQREPQRNAGSCSSNTLPEDLKDLCHCDEGEADEQGNDCNIQNSAQGL